jgi:hypothetical protein
MMIDEMQWGKSMTGGKTQSTLCAVDGGESF